MIGFLGGGSLGKKGGGGGGGDNKLEGPRGSNSSWRGRINTGMGDLINTLKEGKKREQKKTKKENNSVENRAGTGGREGERVCVC